MDDEVEYIRFDFDFNYYKGWVDAQIPPHGYWNTMKDFQDNRDQNLVLVINHELNDYSIVPDFRFKIPNLILKNQITGGHEIGFRLLNPQKKQLPFNVKI